MTAEEDDILEMTAAAKMKKPHVKAFLAAWKTLLGGGGGGGAPASPAGAPAPAPAALEEFPEPEPEEPWPEEPAPEEQAAAPAMDAQLVVITVARHGTHDLWLPPARISRLQESVAV